MAVPPRDPPDEPVAPPPVDSSARPPCVVPLNQAAAVYEALAAGIRGAAVDWTPEAVDLLEDGLRQRYGHLLGGDTPIQRLVELATRPHAA